jgi:hypothetical protein
MVLNDNQPSLYFNREDRFNEALSHKKFLPKAKCRSCQRTFFILKNTILYKEAIENIVHKQNLNYFRELSFKECPTCWDHYYSLQYSSERTLSQDEYVEYIISESKRRSLTTNNDDIEMINPLFYKIEVVRDKMSLFLVSRSGTKQSLD